ncbi:hypothetical protein K435DRAFT_760491 [Dendrothele bispora CBS 962.96]|uniref:P-loop containing nucleoside triphosphate hydrolase protein n=1 Tax=Dendrothele bispora (strain CBS 962.96) TaxID=1314807 RepID=A0A4S8LMB2_DENBC|nr:hypothetical protein K435DRAFT_760491 [Dendrothele bispora CBS 962.96]
MSRFNFRRKNSRRKEDSSIDNSSSASIVDDENTAVGDRDIGTIKDSDYARKCRELMQLNKKLRDLGAEEMFPLPCVTVIGGQSAGKSSLVEAVSGINVPRDSGTCTRCPMECEMSSSGTSWSCTVSLRIKYDENGAPIESKKHIFSPLITNPSEVELWIRRAQAAILYHPHRPADEFKTKGEDELREMVRQDAKRPQSKMLKFSKNMVVVELQDPELTDLFFYDLPGLIQNEEEDIINLVRNLVVDHIGGDQSENNIILITIPMSDDIENQQAVKLARECDPEGARTIGVLTKPDSLGEGAIGQRKKWKDVLEDREHKLLHGYYCVRLPDDAQRAQLSRTDFQQIAQEYFDTRTPWSQMSVRNRFGVPNLVSDVSKLLVELIETNLPRLKAEVDRLLTQNQEELHRLPSPPTSEPIAEVSQMVNTFCAAVKELVLGDGLKKTLVQKDRKEYAKLKQRIWATSYDFRPFVNHKDYEDPKLDNEESLDSKVTPSPERALISCKARPLLDLLDVRQVIVDSTGFELPGHVPFEATKKLVRGATDEWRGPTVECFNAVHTNLWEALEMTISTTFKQYSRLEKAISSIVRRELDSRKDDAFTKLEQKVKHETNPLYTQNYHYFSSEKTKWDKRYRTARNYAATRYWIYRPREAPAHSFPGHVAVAPHSSSTQTAINISDSPRVQEVVWDEYEDELNLMANVQAYFKVAYKRFIDDTPLLIEHELNQALAHKLPFVIFEDLLSGDKSQRIKDLLAEDPSIAKHRRMLQDKIEKLNDIKERLADF